MKPRDGGPPPAVHAFGRRSPNDVVLFTSHVASPMILRAFRRLQAEAPAWLDVRFLMHLPAGAPPAPNIIGVTDADLRCLAYRAKLPGGQVRIVPGNADLLVLWFARTFPAYERYWTIEYDVDFSGNWATFFDAFGPHDPTDLLAATVCRYDDTPAWRHWGSLVAPPRFRATNRLRCYLPVNRVTRRAVAVISHAYAAGWGGHHEVAWPTILAMSGLTIGDFGGDGPFVAPQNRNRFYVNNRYDANLAPGSFVYRPAIAHRPLSDLPDYGDRPKNWLWHPVKLDGEDAARRQRPTSTSAA